MLVRAIQCDDRVWKAHLRLQLKCGCFQCGVVNWRHYLAPHLLHRLEVAFWHVLWLQLDRACDTAQQFLKDNAFAKTERRDEANACT